MMTVLRQAFALAASCHHTISNTCMKIHDAYDRMGCFLWRAMMDDQFLAMKTNENDSGLYRQTAGYYGWGKDKLTNWGIETLSFKGASGDLCPKPDFKPVIFNAGQAVMPYMTRNPLMIGALFLTAVAIAYAATHVGAGHGAADTIGTIYGASPSGKIAPNAKPD